MAERIPPAFPADWTFRIIPLLITSGMVLSCGAADVATPLDNSCRQAELAMTIDSVQGSGGFYRIEGVQADVGGGLYVLDGGENRLYALERDGRLRWSTGRQGAGPEEFLGPNGLALLGDTLVVYDQGNHRMSFWNRDGKHLGIRSLNDFGLSGYPTWFEALGADRIVATIFPPFYATAAIVQFEGAVVIASTDVPLDTVAAITYKFEPYVRGGLLLGEVPQPYLAGVYYAPLADGRFVLVRGEDYLVTIHTAVGGASGSLRGPAIRPAIHEWHRREFLEQLQDSALISRIEFPTLLPSISRLVTTADGSILVGTNWWTKDGNVRWDRWDNNGRFVYSFVASRSLQLFTGAGGWLYGLTEDSMGVQSIAVYQITDAAECPGPAIGSAPAS